MAQATIINKFGRIAGWNSLTIRFLNRNIEAVTELEYDDDQVMDNEHGAGKYPLGQSEGNYNAKAAVTLYAEELNSLVASLPPGTRIQDIPAFEIIAQYEYNGFVMKDVIRNCRFKNNGRSPKQGEGKMLKKIEILTSHIDWNVK